SAIITARLAEMEDRPWPEWKHGKPITTRQLAKLLAPFEIVPGTVRLNDGTTAEGYSLGAFSDAFARYLPADPSQRHNADETGISRDSRSVTRSSALRIENLQKASNGADCDVVTDRKVGMGEEQEALWTA